MRTCVHPAPYTEGLGLYVPAGPYRADRDPAHGAVIHAEPLRAAVGLQRWHTCCSCLADVVGVLAADDDQIQYAVLTAAATALRLGGVVLARQDDVAGLPGGLAQGTLRGDGCEPFNGVLAEAARSNRILQSRDAAGAPMMRLYLAAMSEENRRLAVTVAAAVIAKFASGPHDYPDDLTKR